MGSTGKNEVPVIDLFSGAGGQSFPLALATFRHICRTSPPPAGMDDFSRIVFIEKSPIYC
jgi:hypothetical protein